MTTEEPLLIVDNNQLGRAAFEVWRRAPFNSYPPDLEFTVKDCLLSGFMLPVAEIFKHA